MKPIWYFVGLILVVMGIIIEAAGIYYWFVPPEKVTVLSRLHPNLWWGLIMIGSGLTYYLKNKNKVVE